MQHPGTLKFGMNFGDGRLNRFELRLQFAGRTERITLFPFFCICMNRSPMRQERMAQEISTGTPPLQLFKHPPIQIRKRERKHSPPRFHTSQADLHTAYRCSCLSQKERGRIPSTFCKSWRIRKPPRRRAPPRYGATDCTWPYGRNATSNRS